MSFKLNPYTSQFDQVGSSGGGGGGSPSGPTGSIQFNDSGSFGGSSATIDSAGNMILGTGNASITHSLPRSTTTDNGFNLTITGSGAKIGATDASPGTLTLSSGPSTGRGTETSAIVFSAPLDDGATGTTDKPATEKLKITSYGNVTIGDPSIDSVFYVQGSTGFVGIGMAPSLSEQPASQLTFGESANQTIRINRRSITNAVGRSLSILSGSASVGGTNRPAGTLFLRPGISTGNANATVQITTRALGTSGTADSPIGDLRRFSVDQRGDVIIGDNSTPLATSATGGFLQISKTAGTPTGTPTTSPSSAPIIVDSTNDKLYIYTNGNWHDVSKPGITQSTLLANTSSPAEIVSFTAPLNTSTVYGIVIDYSMLSANGDVRSGTINIACNTGSNISALTDTYGETAPLNITLSTSVSSGTLKLFYTNGDLTNNVTLTGLIKLIS